MTEICLKLDDQQLFYVLCYKQKDDNNKVVLELNGTSDFIVMMNIKGNYVEMAKSNSTNLSLKQLDANPDMMNSEFWGTSIEPTKETVEKSNIENKPIAEFQQHKPNATIRIKHKIMIMNQTESAQNGQVNQGAYIGEQLQPTENGGMISQEKLSTKPSQVDDQQKCQDPQSKTIKPQQRPSHPKPNLIQSTNSSQLKTHESQQTSSTSQQFSEQQLDNQNKPKPIAQENSNEFSLIEYAQAFKNHLITFIQQTEDLQKMFITQKNGLSEKQFQEWKFQFNALIARSKQGIEELKQLVPSSQLEEVEQQEKQQDLQNPIVTNVQTNHHTYPKNDKSVSVSETNPAISNSQTTHPQGRQIDQSADTREIRQTYSQDSQQQGQVQGTSRTNGIFGSRNTSGSQTQGSQQASSTTSQLLPNLQLVNQNNRNSDAQENSKIFSLAEFAKPLEHHLIQFIEKIDHLCTKFNTQKNELSKDQFKEWKLQFYVLIDQSKTGIQELKQLVASSQLEKVESQETNLTSASTDQHIDRVKQQSVANTPINETKPNHSNLSTTQPLTRENYQSEDSTEISEENSKGRQQKGLGQSTNLCQGNFRQTNPSTSRLTSRLTDKSVDIPTLLGPFRKVSDSRSVQAQLQDFVGVKVPIYNYYDEFQGPKRERLKDQFSKLGILNYRRIRGDGNCFYTALGFRLLEVLTTRFGGVGFCQFIQDLKFQPINLDYNSLVTKEAEQQFVKDFLCQCILHARAQNRPPESLFKYNEKFLFYEAFTIFIRSLVFERRQSVIGQETDLGSLALMVEPEGVLTWEEECSNFIEVIIRIIAETLDITIWVVQTDRVDKYNEKQSSQIPRASQSTEIIKLLFNPGHYALVY